MTQLILNISDPSILPTLKKVVKAFKGVTIDTPAKNKKCGLDEALDDVKAGHVHTAASTDQLFHDILGI